jgi:hypothetical protein
MTSTTIDCARQMMSCCTSWPVMMAVRATGAVSSWSITPDFMSSM